MKKDEAAKAFLELLDIVDRLRGPDGCPWDKEQTHESLLPYFIEEAYEVLESVDTRNWINFQEELGDVLLHIVLQTQIAKESGKFNIIDSLQTVNEKLIRRHPHVFGGKKANGALDAKQNWETMKHVEKKRKSRLDGVPVALPALTRSQRLQQKASYAGFDWSEIDEVWGKLDEEIVELKNAHNQGNIEEIKEEIGDVLFSVVNLARHLDVPAEDMLRKANHKFVRRFTQVEKKLESKGKKLEDSSIEEMDEVWEQIKKNE